MSILRQSISTCLTILALINAVHAQTTTGNATTATPVAQPPANATLPAASASIAISGDYILRSNDVVSVNVFQEPDLACTERLAGDGTISMPLVGRIRIAGLTPIEASNVINSALKKGYLVHPQATVSISEVTKEYCTILGKVNRPGPIELPANGRASLLQVIGMAGGFNELANPSKITIKRTVNGEDTILQVDADKIAKSKQREAVTIKPGDVITVKERLF